MNDKNKSLPFSDDLSNQISCSCHQCWVGKAPLIGPCTAHSIGPGVCRKEGVCLECTHTLKQQVF